MALYRRFAQLVRECGPVVIIPTKTRIGFQSRLIFASVDRLTAEGMQVHVVLPRRVEHPRFAKIRSLSLLAHAHYFSVQSVDELDEEVGGWLKEAYAIGRQPVRVRPRQGGKKRPRTKQPRQRSRR